MRLRLRACPDGYCDAETDFMGCRGYQSTCETSLEIHQSSAAGSRTKPASLMEIPSIGRLQIHFFANSFTIYDDSASAVRFGVKLI